MTRAPLRARRECIFPRNQIDEARSHPRSPRSDDENVIRDRCAMNLQSAARGLADRAPLRNNIDRARSVKWRLVAYPRAI
jgi:hypothetical protein